MDTLQVLGSGAADSVAVSAGALEAVIFNGLDGVNFPTDVEHVMLQVRSGADQIVLSSVAESAALQKVTLDLRPSTAVSTGDGYPDTILVNGTTGADNINITGATGSVTLSGLAPTVVIQGSDYARDTVTVVGGFEADVLNAQGIAADVVRLVMRGGQGADTISVADLGGTAVRQVALDLAGQTSSVGDGQPDTISITALTSNAIATTLGPGTMGITWAGVRYSVTGVETPNDRLIVQTAAGSAPTIVSAVETNSADADH